MADKLGAKKPMITPGGAKNIAAAKAAFGTGGAAAPTNGNTGSPAARSRAGEAAKNPYPADKKGNATNDAKSTAATAAATTTKGAAPPVATKGGATAPAPADKEEEKKVTTSSTPKPSKVAPASNESSPEVSSEESDSESESDVDSDASDHKKKKQIDVGVSLSSIKAAFQQDNQQRQQVKKGYDAEEFKKQVKDAGTAGSNDATAENQPEAQNPDVVKSAVLSDLGLDALKKANASNLKNRFEHYNDKDDKAPEEKDELLELKERSAASANKSKWENPDTFVNPDKEVRVKDDIEVAASKATKMKEKFERKVRKEERKAKTPKPKARSSVQADHHE